MQEEQLKLEDLLGREKISDGLHYINNVAIIGAGIMGQGIAQTIASAGIEVKVIEKDKKHLDKANAKLSESIDREIRRWSITESEKRAILSRINWADSLEEIKNCELVIEAVEENFDLKVEIFKQMDKLAKKDAIFVSNTSTLSLTKISEATTRPDRIIGMHFLIRYRKFPWLK
jgi:3-hydroxybutyryl-CoA dehydrogenase